MITDHTPLLSRPDTTIAVVGATDSPGKYGGIIYRDLKRRGFRVFAVNPNRDTVDGDPSYPSLSDLPEDPTIIDLVVPPWEAASVVEEADRLGHTKIWFQPGSETPDLVDAADRRGLEVQADACIMVRARVAAQTGR